MLTSCSLLLCQDDPGVDNYYHHRIAISTAQSRASGRGEASIPAAERAKIDLKYPFQLIDPSGDQQALQAAEERRRDLEKLEDLRRLKELGRLRILPEAEDFSPPKKRRRVSDMQRVAADGARQAEGSSRRRRT